MRDYLSPAKRYVSRVIPHPSVVRGFIIKRRAVVFVFVASTVAITTLGVISVRGLVGNEPKNDNNISHEVKTEGQTSSLSTTNATTESEGAMKSDQPADTNTSINSENGKTSVTVNNQQIPVPENGSVSRTITSDNGTTQVNVSSNSSSSGNSVSSSVSSTSLNSNSSTNSFSQNISISSQ